MDDRAATPLPGSHCLFGEAPLWDAAAGRLLWIDCLRPALHGFDIATGLTHRIDVDLPELVAGLVGRKAGGLVLVGSDGLSLVAPTARERMALPLALDLAHANDGKCDRQGRLWFGSGDGGGSHPPGLLVRIDPDRRVTVADTGFGIPNGPAFSRDGRTLYLADSARDVVYAYDLEPATGALGARRVFARVPTACGHPDGMTVDAEDRLWVAGYGGGCVMRFGAAGDLERAIAVPAPRVTSVAFGGPGLATLYVTTAAIEWSRSTVVLEAARRAPPGPPAVYALQPGIGGIAETDFAG